MASTDEGARKVNVGDLRGLIIDSDELAKGTKVFDDKGLQSLARHQNKVYAEAKGSGPAPYRVSLVFSESSSAIKGHCTCMAARSRPFCKHAAALLVAWSRAPESFVVSDKPLAGMPGEPKKKAVKKGDADPAAQRRDGIEQVSALVRELGVAGIGSGEQLEAIQRIGEALRENKLRRLGARTLDLAVMLRSATARKAPVPATAYTELLTDLRLTARKLERHLGGEPIEDRHVEELIGKTWAKADRKPVTGLDLIEYAYLIRPTSDGFKIYESRFVDVATGTQYSEKQIDPPPPAPRREPKAVRAGAVLAGASGTTFPTFTPLRLSFTDLGDSKSIDDAALARLLTHALPDVGAALTALQEHRKDVFAPDLLPVTVRIDTLFARGARLQAVDATGNALHLPPDPQLEDRLGTALHEGRLEALIGDVGLDAALPTLWPMALVLRGPLGLELRSLIDANAPAIKVTGLDPDERGWVAAARAAGASEAAITLGEVREELAFAFVLGLAALGSRTTDPLSSRLRDLGLDRPAALLDSLPLKPEPADRIDDFIRIFQVLGIALMRLAGATQVDRAALAPVPTYESVFVAQPSTWIDPERVEKLRGEGKINRYEAAVHYAHHYEGLPAEELAEQIYPIWANGSAQPYVVRAFAGKGELAIAAAKKALASARGRIAKITAIRVLQAVAMPEASDAPVAQLASSPEATEALTILRELAMNETDVGLRAGSANARDAVELQRGFADVVRARRAAEGRLVDDLCQAVISAPQFSVRAIAIEKLTTLGAVDAIPALRQAFLCDAAVKVRKEAALALGLLGDVEMADHFVDMLRRRGTNDVEAKLGARALGNLGDVRGLHELLVAYSEGYDPKILAESLRALGPVALDPLLALIETHPDLAQRKAALSVLAEQPERDLTAALVARVHASAGDPRLIDRSTLYLKLAGVNLDSRRVVAEAILAILPTTDEAKALLKAAKKAAS
ncbi:MAG: HEAT repeat domain-containing protein [Byssovorax sp.]